MKKKKIKYFLASKEANTYIIKKKEEILKSRELFFGKGLFSRNEQEFTQREDKHFFPKYNYQNELTYKNIGGLFLYCLNNKEKNSPYNFLYIHGGAYIGEISLDQAKFCDDLVSNLGGKIYIPLFPLISKNTSAKDAYDFILKVYHGLLNEGKPICLLGDSAGGTIALGFCEYLKEIKEKLPEKIILICPWLDATLKNIKINCFLESDLFLKTYGLKEYAKLWAKDIDVSNYKISPINGNYHHFPDILIFIGTNEILFPDCYKFYRNIKDTNILMIVGIGLWHTYPLINEIKEKQLSIKEIKNFINKK